MSRGGKSKAQDHVHSVLLSIQENERVEDMLGRRCVVGKTLSKALVFSYNRAPIKVSPVCMDKINLVYNDCTGYLKQRGDYCPISCSSCLFHESSSKNCFHTNDMSHTKLVNDEKMLQSRFHESILSCYSHKVLHIWLLQGASWLQSKVTGNCIWGHFLRCHSMLTDSVIHDLLNGTV